MICKILATCFWYDVSTCIKVHQNAGLVTPCLLIGQFPSILASDWSPLVAKYVVKDAGGLSPPAGSRWLRPLSRQQRRGLLHHPAQFKVPQSSVSQMVQSKTQPCPVCGSGLVLHDVRSVLAPKSSQFFPLSLFPARPILMSVVYAGCVISSSQSEASIADINQWEGGICWLYPVIIYPALTL